LSSLPVNIFKTKSALYLYRLVFLLVTPLILLLLILRSKKNAQYRARLLERLGFFPPTNNNSSFTENSIIIHAASVGEVIAIKSFVESLLKKYPNKTNGV
jgi:3-deoxy-D-manno-octulosonic-acid transferase